MPPLSNTPETPRRAIITGGASGIGRAICRQLANLGWVVAVVDIDGAAAERTAAELANPIGESLALAADVAEADAWRRLVEDLQSRWPRLDLLVNNAGVLAGGEVAASDPDDLRRVIDVNLTGTILGCRAAAEWLIASAERERPADGRSPRSGVINTSSIFAPLAPPGFAAYNASKAGVAAFSEALRGELAPHGLNVTATLPGVVGTGLFAAARFATPRFAEAAERFALRAELSPERVATATLRAAHAGRGQQIIGPRARRLAWLRWWLPGLSRRAVRERARRELGVGVENIEQK